ncbi:hypothetical protein DFH09DRAFT_1364825 [Mycena vulgaris]|nr:hypothetical protein DFH09DRAFT_1364825 [Mycena vulgaris]
MTPARAQGSLNASLSAASAAFQFSAPAPASDRASASAWFGESASGSDTSFEPELRLLPLVLPAEPALCALAGFGARVRVFLCSSNLYLNRNADTRSSSLARARARPPGGGRSAAVQYCTRHGKVPCSPRLRLYLSRRSRPQAAVQHPATAKSPVPASPLIAWRATTRHDSDTGGYRILVPHLVDPKHSSIGFGAPNAEWMCSVWVCGTAGDALSVRLYLSFRFASHSWRILARRTAHGAHDPRQRRRTLAQAASPAPLLLVSRTPSFPPRSHRSPSVPFLFLCGVRTHRAGARCATGHFFYPFALTYAVLHPRLRRPLPTPTGISPPRIGLVAANGTHTPHPTP